MKSATTKVCNGCERELPLAEFAKKGNYRQPRCRACRSDEQALCRGRKRERTAAKPVAPKFDQSIYPRWLAPMNGRAGLAN
jgi:hypothetical protein